MWKYDRLLGIAWVMYQKFCNSLPYTRQEKDWAQYGVAITRATMANWVIRNTLDYFTPMYDYFHRQLLKREFAMADETPLQVLHESGRRAQTKSYMWLFRSGEDGEFPIILYKYAETRTGNNAVEFLEGFKGYLMCDGYSGYNKVPDAKRTACWAHIRRYLTDAIPKGKQLDYTQPSVQGINWKELLKMSAVMLVGMFAGIQICRIVKSENILLTIYGIIIVVVALKNLCIHTEKKLPDLILWIVLILAGIIHGMFVSGGALLVIYATQVLKEKEEFRATVAPVWVVLNFFLMVTQFRSGLVGTADIRLICISILPLLIATWLGKKLVCKVSQKVFLNLTYILLLISGVSLIV